MAAGLEDHVGSIENIVGLLEDSEARQPRKVQKVKLARYRPLKCVCSLAKLQKAQYALRAQRIVPRSPEVSV